MSALRVPAPAKINLALAVDAVRDDGYHLLRSVFLRLALHDELEVEVDPSGTVDRLGIEGELEATADNLVLRASAMVRQAIGGPLPALRFSLHKRIPAAAGLGGGSADAAAAVELALQAWGARLPRDHRLDIALRLGADVPFFVAGHDAALVEGVGERLTPLPAPHPPAGLVLITPQQRLSTAAVFAELDRRPSTETAAARRVDGLAALLGRGIDGAALADATAGLHDANDLWAPATRLSPRLVAARDAAERILGRSLLLSGSGPTLFSVYPSKAAAARAAIALEGERPTELEGATVVTTTTSGRGAGS